MKPIKIKIETSADIEAAPVDAIVMWRLLHDLKAWDINNKMEQGQHLIPLRFRRRMQAVLSDCPNCGSDCGITEPRNGGVYCEDCGWPDDDRAA